MTYDFNSLSPSDFEELSRDLLQAEFQIRLESFTSGRDLGIDLRYVRPSGQAWIIQCKHFYRSGYRLLLANLTKEAEKVKKLSPERYILTTSLGLTPANKADISAIFYPFIKSTADILGVDDINNLLRKHPQVEKAHFKLWLASSSILQRILSHATFARTDQILAELPHQVRLYVSNDSFNRALDILKEKHVCIIAGIPGIGKTFLARMLMLHHLQQEYEAIVLSSDIEEANGVYEPSHHQFFYYDDFLGQSFDESLPKNEDARLVDFIQRVSRSPNKRLVLTTREYILNRATSRYERLSHALDHDLKCVIRLEDYTRLVKGRILYNHLFFSQLPPKTVAAFCVNHSYWEVIKHENFSPRLIEFAISKAATAKYTSAQFPKFLVDILDHPERLWDHAFRHHLSPQAQALLLALLFLPKSATLQDLSAATVSLVRCRNRSALSGVDFTDCLKSLEGTFVVIEAPTKFSCQIRFFTPAIADYLLRLIDRDRLELTYLATGAIFFEQLTAIRAAAESSDGKNLAEIQYRFPGLRLWIRDNVQVFVEAAQRTFSSESCLWRNLQWRHTQPIRQAPSAESRCVEILKIADDLDSEDLRSWATTKAIELSARWRDRTGDRAAAADLIGIVEVPNDTRLALKDWLLDGVETADDFDAALRIVDTAPDIIDEKFHEDLLGQFSFFLQSQIDYILHDADDAGAAESAMEEVEQVAALMGISPEWNESILLEHIEDLRPRDDDFDSDLARESHSTVTWGKNFVSDEARIDTLFDSLARSLE